MSVYEARTTGGGANATGISNNVFRIGLAGPTFYTGTADPTVTPPTPVDDGYRDGDWYIRTLTGAEALWIYQSGTWTQLATGGGGGSFAGDIIMNPGAQFLGDPTAVAGAPAYAFDGDTDTGIFQNSPDELSFSTGGVERFIIESDGTLASTTAGYEALITSDNDIPNRKYVEDNFLNVTGDTMPGDLTFTGTGQLFLADGSVADPGLAFANDTNNGIFLDTGFGADSYTFSSGGTGITTISPAGLTMRSGQIIADNGTVGAPGIVFAGDPTTGFYQTGPGDTSFSSAGSQTALFDGSGIQVIDGSAGTPSYSFISDPNSGMFLTGADTLAWSTNGTEHMSLDDDGDLTVASSLRGFDGSPGNPTFRWASDDNTGMYLSAADQISWSTGGSEQARLDSAGNHRLLNGVYLGVNGSAANPTFSFATDTDTGMFRNGNDELGFSAGGNFNLFIGASALVAGVPTRVTESAQSAATPGFSFEGDPDSGLYRSAANEIGLSTGGTGRWVVQSDGDFVPTSNNAYDIGASGTRVNTVYATTFDGTATAARYSDLAERYTVGDCCELEPGDVVCICDHEDHDICKCDHEADDRVLGVVSTAPGFMMNKDAGDDKTAPYIALRGRVPVKVCGTVKKGDLLISCGGCDPCGNDCSGHARALTKPEKHAISPHAVFAKALSADKDGVCEAVIL